MLDFLFKYYSILTHLVEFVSAISGFFLLHKYKNSEVKYFIYFLIYIVICELLASYTRFVRDNGFLSFLEGTLIEKNHWWATLYWQMGAIVFFSYYYQKILRGLLFKKIIKIVTCVFLIFSTTYIIFNWQDFFIRFFPSITIFGAIIIFLCTMFYFFELLQSDNILTFYKSVNFYISATIFIWWLIITPIVFFDKYQTYILNVYEFDREYVVLRGYVYLVSNILMYSTFTFALIYCRPKTRKN